MTTMASIDETLDSIIAKSQGSLNIERHYGKESGFNAKEYVEVLEKGLMEIAAIPAAVSYNYPWLKIGAVPFLATDFAAREVAVRAIEPMLDAFCEEHGIVPLAYFVYKMSPCTVLYSTKEVTSLASTQGMLIRTYDAATMAFAEGLGGVPTSLQLSELYLGLQKGTVDAALTGPSEAENQHLEEVAKYMMITWPLVRPCILGINKAAFNRLPADLQKAFIDDFEKWEADWWVEINEQATFDKVFDYATTHGMKVYEGPADVKAEFPKIRDRNLMEVLDESGEKGKQAWQLIKTALINAGYKM